MGMPSIKYIIPLAGRSAARFRREISFARSLFVARLPPPLRVDRPA